MMIERILVPLDGSLLAQQALPLAAVLARPAGARLILLHAGPMPADPLVIEGQHITISEQVARLRALARRSLEHAAHSLAEEQPPLTIELETVAGPAPTCIIEFARSNDGA